MAYTAVLIDDESWALLGICHSFPWEKYGFEVVLQETNAARAISYILEHRPDAVFTDIRMNNISGLDLIRTIREAGLDTEFVIISGYSDFRYAQSAIQSNVFQYLLKPLDLTETDSVLQGLANRLVQKKASFSAYDWVDDARSSKKTFLQLCEQKRIQPRHSGFYIAMLGSSEPPEDLLRHQQIQILDVIHFGLRKCIVIFCTDDEILPVFSVLKKHMPIGLSRPASEEEGLYVKFREADIAYTQYLFSGSSQEGFYARDAARETAQVAARLVSVFAAAAPETICAAMKEGLSTLAPLRLTVEDLALLYSQIRTGLMANPHYHFSDGLDPLDYRTIQALFPSQEDFFVFLTELVTLERFASDKNTFKSREQMDEILAYIEENYTRPLYLSDLSQRFYLSQTSICDLFRRNMKTSFMNYLTEKRIRRARQLLSATQMSIMEIAENTGYRDQYYFSRIFKKLTGLTPQQYRKLHAAERAGEG